MDGARDTGADEETMSALQANGEGRPWGEGVLDEYEVYRPDRDGDGLSDKWEILNDRNPIDGLLYFDFDCGGWQTEGWFQMTFNPIYPATLATLIFIGCRFRFNLSRGASNCGDRKGS